MKAVPTPIIEKILQLYKPNCQFLSQVEVDYPYAKGEFTVHYSFYLNRILLHLNAVEAQLCANQLSYAALNEWFTHGALGYKYTQDEFFQMMDEGFLIAETSLKFQRLVELNKPVHGNIEILSHKYLFKKHYLSIRLDFCDKSVIGEMKIVVDSNMILNT